MPLHRRTLLTGAAALPFARPAAAQTAPEAAPAPPAAGTTPAPPETAPVRPGADLETISLWPGMPPGGGGPDLDGQAFDESREGVIQSVARPCLMVVRPARPNGTAMLIAAGGGYRRIDIGHEALPTARWLAGQGVTAFVFVYRLPGEGWAAGADAPIQDVQRAIRLVRARAPRYGYEPGRIAVLGFSAGGHLMGSATVRFGSPLYEPVDEDDALSARPDLAALIYPVITLRPPFDRTSSRRVLVGERPTRFASNAYSVELHVRSQSPPTFLAQAADDPVAVVDNCLLMYGALRAADVPAEMHLFERGGHGFALGVPGTPAAAWPGLFYAWARRRGFVRG
ncbi:alpha/beta hydrolase [Methylobacterium sp. ID0610]|uniref:alpha/beta hydrolase n=1 Tax=Methylobacterium carpenticola TaxID=3344827 RepID=UPI0036AC2A86